jgi:hypothetical protein
MAQKKAFVRYAQNKAVPGSLIVRTKAPKVGTWKEVPYDICCGGSSSCQREFIAPFFPDLYNGTYLNMGSQSDILREQGLFGISLNPEVFNVDGFIQVSNGFYCQDGLVSNESVQYVNLGGYLINYITDIPATSFPITSPGLYDTTLPLLFDILNNYSYPPNPQLEFSYSLTTIPTFYLYDNDNNIVTLTNVTGVKLFIKGEQICDSCDYRQDLEFSMSNTNNF